MNDCLTDSAEAVGSRYDIVVSTHEPNLTRVFFSLLSLAKLALVLLCESFTMLESSVGAK
jgi:hypothetical protein